MLHHLQGLSPGQTKFIIIINIVIIIVVVVLLPPIQWCCSVVSTLFSITSLYLQQKLQQGLVLCQWQLVQPPLNQPSRTTQAEKCGTFLPGLANNMTEQ